MVVEELLHPHGVILLVGGLLEAVVLPDVLEHDDRLLQTPEGVVVLDALVPVDGPVLVVVEDDQGRVDLLGVVDRRVALIGLEVVPVAAREPPLAALEDRLVG
jgi:hypothetical protein